MKPFYRNSTELDTSGQSFFRAKILSRQKQTSSGHKRPAQSLSELFFLVLYRFNPDLLNSG